MAQQIFEFPLIGRVVPEIKKPDFRERFVYSYRLIYKVDDIKITILAVIHGKRLLENVFERF